MPLSVAAAVNPLISALADTISFGQPQWIARDILGQTELTDERAKAASPRRTPPVSVDLQAELPRWAAEARRRGVDYVTYRRLAEELGHTDVAALRWSLTQRNPELGRIPLWKVTA